MLIKLNKYTYLVLAIGILVAAAIIENGLLRRNPETKLIDDFQSQLLVNESKLHDNLADIKNILLEEELEENISEFFGREQTLIRQTGFGAMVFKGDELFFWSDRGITFYDHLEDVTQTSGLAKLPNGYYLVDTLHVGEYTAVGYHLIKRNYTYENKYLQNNFYKSYKLPSDYLIRTEKYKHGYDIVNLEGDYLFTLLPYGNYLCTTNQLYFPGAIYFIGLILLLFYFRKEFVDSDAPFFLKLVTLGVSLFVVYWIHLIFEVPKVFFHLKFFSPDYFAINDWLPSLGDYFLLAIFFLFWIYNFAFDLNIDDLHKNSSLPRKGIIVLLLIFNAGLYLLVDFFIKELIYNSTVSFALNKIIDISPQSVLGIFAVSLLLLGVVFFTIRVNEKNLKDFKFHEIVLITLVISLFNAGVQYLAVQNVSIYALLLFIICVILSSLISRHYLQSFTLSYMITYVAVVSIYSLVVINRTISKMDKGQQKLLAVTLVAERDPAAEVFMAEIQQQITKDPEIPELLVQGRDEDAIEHIRELYFNTYFRKYLLNILVCHEESNLLIPPDDYEVSCMPYLNDKIESEGIQIPGTNFYFMDNMNGRISYTGRLHYPLVDNGQGITIYIDLDSDLLFEGIGFPELLIDKSMARSDIYRKFNYAKYYAGELTDKFGDYNYNYNGHVYLKSDEEFAFLRQDKYEHLVYHTSKQNYVVVSRELLTPIDYLISFPYLFVFYFLTLLVVLVIVNQSIRERRVFFDLKFKIQAAIISIVFISLMVVAGVTLFYNVKEYRQKHQDDLNEKMKSIAEEIDMRLTDKNEITPEQEEWLREELSKLSNIFRTDINIYGTDGRLIASSRFEIFERGLVSSRINARASYEVFQNFSISYFQPENIGKLSYLSAYRPIINNNGDYLGVINLPYFIRQDNYSQEISTFIVAFINLYVLLFLASIIAAVFIANQITRPLVVIQENLQKMQLGKRNEPIQYNKKDEIGSLVREYNKKVDELAISADLLARSERESAWREMAKQIAHEIKNPLTPMKLNIQYLQRAKGSNEEYNEFLERVTSTLIEQIDNLSNIATEFSNFAKIPTARNQVFCLAEQLKKTIDLYETHDKIHIDFNSNGYDHLEVNADREQLSRAIINLIRNAIQAIPQDRFGEVKIKLERRDYMAVISVKDNGSGIDAELRDKLFSPSFTTKTSGMGLGLSIVKNIVENFAGRIWFETKMGKGTTFFLEIPVYENADENNSK
ncbi:HAMP domain-containing sensor histidine kinase [Draconibacterium sp. IB214405]|uniref:sensor histidine kinase n=1 Tax=Draconibacterium sp. IB214405 TaxID=3097352 RepID=UPI002A1220E9|nr:HAMP domain-containing sensor histidine kinase [Draconibacterium sp. IB214405]MDX8341501.1 HAMP domain-containing sensor histidine kinase [Draconibacterium sp. IB214405]